MEKYKISDENILFMDNSMKAAHCREEKNQNYRSQRAFSHPPSPHKVSGRQRSLSDYKKGGSGPQRLLHIKGKFGGPGLMGLRGSHKTKVPFT